MKAWGWWRRDSPFNATPERTARPTGGGASTEPDWGLVWLVDDDAQQRRMFEHSYRSACRWMPAARKHVWVIGQPLSIDCDCPQRPLLTEATQWAAKFDAWRQSPFQTTVFLDNDTFVLRDLEPLVRANPSVTALAYPNLLRRETVPESLRAGLPKQWRNINSGVVIFDRAFMAHYELFWQKLRSVANQVGGKDQYVFSLALHDWKQPWRCAWDLQVVTTPFALEWLRRVWGVAHEPALGRVPLALIHQAYVFHATADKAEYHQRFREWFQLEACNRSALDGTLDERSATTRTDDLSASAFFAPCDVAATPAKEAQS